MRFLHSAVLLASVAAANNLDVANSKVSYDGYKVFRVATHNEPEKVKAEVADVKSAVAMNVDVNEFLDIAVAREDVEQFKATVAGLDVTVINEDIGKDIKLEMDMAAYGGASANAVPDLSWFNSYHPYADHVQFFRDLQAALPTNSELFNVARSYEGRTIFGIHLWGSGGKGSKPAVYFHGTVHAREWISPMVVEYLTYQLINGYGTDSVVNQMLDKYDFYIIPFVNPDGFIFSQTSNRLWRKNRQPRSGTSCVGTDINRNWPFKWDVPGGASTNPCSQTYKGESPADAPEMTGLLQFTETLTNGRGIKLYIDWHSYGQYILLPWGYDCSLEPPNPTYQFSLARETSETIRRQFGRRFTYGSSCATLYATTGDSTDYMTGTAKADLAWTLELRPSSPLGGGFVLPPDQILPSSVEQWEAMKYLITTM